jgi:hypothetical protein
MRPVLDRVSERHVQGDPETGELEEQGVSQGHIDAVVNMKAVLLSTMFDRGHFI